MMKNLTFSFLFFLTVLFISVDSIFAQTDIKVACLGNSITQGMNTITFPTQLDGILGEGWNVQNFGLHSRTLLRKGDYPIWTTNELKNALAFLPDKVIIKLGTNDSKPQNWAFKEEFFANYVSLVDTFANLSSNPEIYVCYPAKAFNHAWKINDSIIVDSIIPLIDSVTKVRNVKLIDLHSFTEDKVHLFYDSIHPNSDGYNAIAEFLFSHLVDSNLVVVHDTNVVYNKPVTVNDLSDTTHKFLVDGDYNYEWKGSALPAQAIIDLGSETEIDFFQLAFSADMVKGYQYKIEGSLDQTDWDMLADQSGRNDTASIMSVDSINAANVRYIRLTITSFSNSSDTTFTIPEFKAYKATGYEHAPMFAAKRTNNTTIQISLGRINPGDALAYYAAVSNLAKMPIANFSASKSEVITYSGSNSTVGAANYYYTVHYGKGVKVISDTSKYTFSALPPVVSGLGNIVAEGKIKVYPNPFSNEVYFSNLSSLGNSAKISIKIFDITGKMVTTISANNTDQIIWDGKDLNSNEVPSGLYICNIENGTLKENIIINKN